MTTIDTHAHLDHLENLSEALQSAFSAGVNAVITVGVDLTANKKNLEIQKQFTQPKIFLGLGIHPGNINSQELDETFQFIRQHIKEAIAVGETGLDYWYKWVRKDEEKKAEQRDVFQKQLMMAREFDLPVIIHSRGAWKDCFEMTRASGVKKALFHWYSGPVDVLKEILDQGYFISAGPSIAYSPQSREAIAFAPVEATLLETDCPVYFQDPDGGFKAEPKDVFRALKAYAELKFMDQDQVINITNQNARDFFAIQF